MASRSPTKTVLSGSHNKAVNLFIAADDAGVADGQVNDAVLRVEMHKRPAKDRQKGFSQPWANGHHQTNRE
jgi:hypothetical protein